MALYGVWFASFAMDYMLLCSCCLTSDFQTEGCRLEPLAGHVLSVIGGIAMSLQKNALVQIITCSN